MLWYHGTWVWRGLEPRGRPVHPVPIKGLTLDSMIPYTPIDSLNFSLFNHARILTSGVYGPERKAVYFTSASMYCTRCLGAICVYVGGIVFVVC